MTTTVPNQLNFTDIDFGDRGRKQYNGIESLAQSILDNGLIHPLILVPLESSFGLDAGGRRYRALQLLLNSGQWDGILYHALTSVPGQAGFVMKGEGFATPLQRVLTEIAENLDRDDLDWRDEVHLTVKAYNLALKEAHANGENILMRDFGAMLGVGYARLRCAVIIHDELIANPDRFKDCTSIRNAHQMLMKDSEKAATKILLARTMGATTPVQARPEPKPEEEVPQEVIDIPLSKSFRCGDSLKFMAETPDGSFDHIVTDPDYGVSVERLQASVVGAQHGIVQEHVDQSVQDMFVLLREGFRITRDGGFLVFWYDLDHHEKLQNEARRLGWKVQRWPLIWHKTDYRSNSAAQHNFCKNLEYAMVCRKPNAVLASLQMSSIYSCPAGDTVKKFGHPFAKPVEISKWIYSAIAVKGQTVYDPFMGSGALSVAAVEWGLKPAGSEINADHFANSILNLQKTFRKLIDKQVTFS